MGAVGVEKGLEGLNMLMLMLRGCHRIKQELGTRVFGVRTRVKNMVRGLFRVRVRVRNIMMVLGLKVIVSPSN